MFVMLPLVAPSILSVAKYEFLDLMISLITAYAIKKSITNSSSSFPYAIKSSISPTSPEESDSESLMIIVVKPFSRRASFVSSDSCSLIMKALI